MKEQSEPGRVNWRVNALIARFVGIVTIAMGFMLGIYALDESTSTWLQTALGLLVTGMLAQGYALYCSIKRMQQVQDRPRS